MSTCPFVITRGNRKGKKCGTKPRSGRYCAQHKKVIAKKATKNKSQQTSSCRAREPQTKTTVNNTKPIIDLFDKLNERWLDNEYILVWDNCKARFGQCHYIKKEISISKHLLNLYGAKELRGTVKHEVAHACDQKYNGRSSGHGQPWKKWAVKLGATPKACSKKRLLTTDMKWVIRNIETGEIYNGYFKKPRRTGPIPLDYIPGKKTETIGKLEIVENKTSGNVGSQKIY